MMRTHTLQAFCFYPQTVDWTVGSVHRPPQTAQREKTHTCLLGEMYPSCRAGTDQT